MTDLKLTKAVSKGTVEVGELFQYTLTVQVLQADPISGAARVVVVDRLPAGLQFAGAAPSGCTITGQRIVCRLGTLPNDAVRSISFSVKALSSGVYINTARVNATGDAVSSNNQGQVSVTVTDTKPAGIPTCANSKPDQAGTPIRFSCKPGAMFNAANAARRASDLACCLPTCANTQVASSIAEPFPCPADRPLKINAGTIRTFSRAACCSTGSVDPQDVPDVSVLKRVRGAATVEVGGTVTFDLIVKVESGLAGVKNVKMVDALPPGLKFVSVKASQSDSKCSNPGGGQEVICTWASLPYKAQRRVTVTATALLAADTITNTATVNGDLDTDPQNNNSPANVTVTGACCVGGSLAARTAADCAAAGGKFFASQSVQQAQSSGACGAPTGPCCRNDGQCVVDTQAACTLGLGKWRQGGSCSALTCAISQSTGACCLVSTGKCSQTTQGQCSGSFTPGAQCSTATCAPVCVAAFQACTPGSSTCCGGNSCVRTPLAYPGAPVTHSCQPGSANTCANVGQPCGACPQGLACCAGTSCKWDFSTHSGSCQAVSGGWRAAGTGARAASSACKAAGALCASDEDACPGFRCVDARIKKAVCDRNCRGNQACEQQRKADCAALNAAVVSAMATRFG